jgi:hypothetical protein
LIPSCIIFCKSVICQFIFISSLANKYLVYFIMSSQSSNSSVASPPSLSVLIENSAALSHRASTSPIFAMDDSTDTLFNESLTSISSSPDVPSDLGSIPPGLTLLGKTRKTRCILYDSAKAEQFMPWWRGTQSGKAMDSKQKSHSWGSGKRTSPAWKDFQEVAAFPGGQPKVRCSHCAVLMEHPQTKNTGTTAMSRHLERSCSSNSDQKRNFDIYKMMFGSEVSSTLIPT